VKSPDPDPTPDPEPDPDPAPELNEIIGNNSRNRLNGTSEDDLILGGRNHDRLFGRDGDDVLIGGADNDRLYGGNGADTFVFGADDRDRDRDRDVIYDFEQGIDTIVLEDGASIRRIVERRGDAFIELNGDRDFIRVRDADRSIIDDIEFQDDLFLG